MYPKTLSSLTATLVTGGLTALLQSPASAAQFHLGWNYALDSPNDSLGVNPDRTIQPGGSIYEIFGMAVKDDVATDSVWFAVSANLPLYGHNLPQPSLEVEGLRDPLPVPDSNIGWGDLVLDFSGTRNLKTASDTRQLFGIKFSINNDSGVPTLGIYRDVSLASVTTTNAGYSNLGNNNATLERLSAERQGARRSASMGDLAWDNSYFAPYTTSGSYGSPGTWMPNIIGSGTKIGEVTLLNRETLVKAGLDPNFFSPSGAEIFGFRLPKELLPVGEFIATLLTECINDGIALSSRLIAPPPPQPTPYICPITDGQRNALLPTQVIDGVKIFQNAPSGAWFDPPANMGFQFVSLDGSLFTGISGFPCAVVPETEDIITAPFNVLVKDETGRYEIIGSYDSGATVDFTKIFGKGVSEFIITGIDPAAWKNPPLWEYNPPEGAPLAFALLLNQETANFGFRRINDITNLPIPEAIVTVPGDLRGSVPGYFFPKISKLPTVIGPTPDPACLENGRCGVVPEPSTVTGILLAALGALKVRQVRRRK